MHQTHAPTMQLRRLERVDARAYRDVRLEASLDPAFAMSAAWFEGMNDSGIYRAFLTNPAGWVTGAFRQQQMLGIVHIDPAAELHEYMLWGLYVMQKERQRGVGEALVSSAIDIAQSISAAALRLHVSASNDSAKRLYQRLGFVHPTASVNSPQSDSELMIKPIAAVRPRRDA
jgi:ribosomal protein S18 acetylase RimI-like enzyme